MSEEIKNKRPDVAIMLDDMAANWFKRSIAEADAYMNTSEFRRDMAEINRTCKAEKSASAVTPARETGREAKTFSMPMERPDFRIRKPFTAPKHLAEPRRVNLQDTGVAGIELKLDALVDSYDGTTMKAILSDLQARVETAWATGNSEALKELHHAVHRAWWIRDTLGGGK